MLSASVGQSLGALPLRSPKSSEHAFCAARLGLAENRICPLMRPSRDFTSGSRPTSVPTRWLIPHRCLEMLKRSFSGKTLRQITPFAIEQYKHARDQAGARVRTNRELAGLKCLYNRCRE